MEGKKSMIETEQIIYIGEKKLAKIRQTHIAV